MEESAGDTGADRLFARVLFYFLKSIESYDGRYVTMVSSLCRYQKLWCDFRQYMVQEYVYATVEGKGNKQNKIEEADTPFSPLAKSQVERADSFGSAKSARHE